MLGFELRAAFLNFAPSFTAPSTSHHLLITGEMSTVGTLPQTIKTGLTDMLGIKHPVMLAGMNAVAHADLVAAVTNAGGIGTIGGLMLSPKALKSEIDEAKALIADKENPRFGVDLAIPQIGGNARKTNHDYTHGHLPELIDIIIEEKASLFVCAVGVPPRWAVDKLHAAGIPIMNMIGHPKHVDKALGAGVDIICAQGSEGGGHTGDIATTVLIPSVIDKCKGRISPLTGKQVRARQVGGRAGKRVDGRAGSRTCSRTVGQRFVPFRFINRLTIIPSTCGFSRALSHPSPLLPSLPPSLPPSLLPSFPRPGPRRRRRWLL